jgi:hypothetical protein
VRGAVRGKARPAGPDARSRRRSASGLRRQDWRRLHERSVLRRAAAGRRASPVPLRARQPMGVGGRAGSAAGDGLRLAASPRHDLAGAVP